MPDWTDATTDLEIANYGAAKAIIRYSSSPTQAREIALQEIPRAALAGTAAAPGFAFALDLNTGMFSPGADQIGFATGGSQRVWIDAEGRVGFGADPGSSRLQIQGPGNTVLRLKGGAGTNEGSAIYFTMATSGSTLGAFGDRAGIMGGTVDQAIGFFTSSVPLVFDVAGAERFRIDGNALLPGGDNAQNLGSGAKRLATLFAASGTINTSDERFKRDIEPIPEEWLDAWGEVEWCRYRFTKGQRWHIGLIAQRVKAAFDARGIDALSIGLLCFDEWPDEIGDEILPAVDGGMPKATGHKIVINPAGDRWGLRYDECFAIEAAWQRREIANLKLALQP